MPSLPDYSPFTHAQTEPAPATWTWGLHARTRWDVGSLFCPFSGQMGGHATLCYQDEPPTEAHLHLYTPLYRSGRGVFILPMPILPFSPIFWWLFCVCRHGGRRGGGQAHRLSPARRAAPGVAWHGGKRMAASSCWRAAGMGSGDARWRMRCAGHGGVSYRSVGRCISHDAHHQARQGGMARYWRRRHWQA